MARLFVAAMPPPEVVEQICRLDRGDDGVRWVPEHQWHVTLRFLRDARTDLAIEALARLDASAAEATVGPAVSTLGRDVLCLPIAGLDELAAAVADALLAVAGPPDRDFRGHLTLGRPRSAGASIALLGSSFSATFPVDRVLLVRSRPGDGPPHHEVIGGRDLAG
jgi:2'-5' RNA ligase